MSVIKYFKNFIKVYNRMPAPKTLKELLSRNSPTLISRILREDAKKNGASRRFKNANIKQLEEKLREIKEQKQQQRVSKQKPAAASASAPASASASAPAAASASAPAAASAPASASASARRTIDDRIADLGSRFTAKSYSGTRRKMNLREIQKMLNLKRNPVNAQAKSQLEQWKSILQFPALSAVPEENNESNESSAEQMYFHPIDGTQLNEESFFLALKELTLCEKAKKHSRTKKAKMKRNMKTAEKRLGAKYNSRTAPTAVSLESQSPSS
jgi:hypothetical protein